MLNLFEKQKLIWPKQLIEQFCLHSVEFDQLNKI